MQENGKGKLSGKRSIEKRRRSNRRALRLEEDRPREMDLLTRDPSIFIQELLLDRDHTRPPRYPFFLSYGHLLTSLRSCSMVGQRTSGTKLTITITYLVRL